MTLSQVSSLALLPLPIFFGRRCKEHNNMLRFLFCCNNTFTLDVFELLVDWGAWRLMQSFFYSQNKRCPRTVLFSHNKYVCSKLENDELKTFESFWMILMEIMHIPIREAIFFQPHTTLWLILCMKLWNSCTVSVQIQFRLRHIFNSKTFKLAID